MPERVLSPYMRRWLSQERVQHGRRLPPPTERAAPNVVIPTAAEEVVSDAVGEEEPERSG